MGARWRCRRDLPTLLPCRQTPRGSRQPGSGRNLRRLRQDQGLTLQQVAERAHHRRVHACSRLEAGKRRAGHRPPARAGRALDVTVDDDPRLRPAARPPPPVIATVPETRDGMTDVGPDPPERAAGGLHPYKIRSAPAAGSRRPSFSVHEGYDWLYVMHGRPAAAPAATTTSPSAGGRPSSSARGRRTGSAPSTARSSFSACSAPQGDRLHLHGSWGMAPLPAGCPPPCRTRRSSTSNPDPTTPSPSPRPGARSGEGEPGGIIAGLDGGGARSRSRPTRRVRYVPLADVDPGRPPPEAPPRPTARYKGGRLVPLGRDPRGDDRASAVWRYEHPYPAVADIAGAEVAFYRRKVEVDVEARLGDRSRIWRAKALTPQPSNRSPGTSTQVPRGTPAMRQRRPRPEEQRRQARRRQVRRWVVAGRRASASSVGSRPKTASHAASPAEATPSEEQQHQPGAVVVAQPVDHCRADGVGGQRQPSSKHPGRRVGALPRRRVVRVLGVPPRPLGPDGDDQGRRSCAPAAATSSTTPASGRPTGRAGGELGQCRPRHAFHSAHRNGNVEQAEQAGAARRDAVQAASRSP